MFMLCQINSIFFYIFLDTLYVSGTWHMVCTICLLNIEALYPTGTLEICCRIAANKQLPSLKECPSLIVSLLCKMKVGHLFVLSLCFTVFAWKFAETILFRPKKVATNINVPKQYCFSTKKWKLL